MICLQHTAIYLFPNGMMLTSFPQRGHIFFAIATYPQEQQGNRTMSAPDCHDDLIGIKYG
jgi:hypothetical protein